MIRWLQIIHVLPFLHFQIPQPPVYFQNTQWHFCPSYAWTRKEENRIRKATWVRWDLTISSAQTDTSQKNITGKRLLVPHSQLQADIPYVPWVQTTESKGVIPLGVHTPFYYGSFVFCSFAVIWEQVPGR